MYKAVGIRFDVLVFGQAGRFSFIQLVLYIGSTLSYYALTTLLLDWLIDCRCYSSGAGQTYSDRKVEAVRDTPTCVLCVAFADQDLLRLVKRPKRRSLQESPPITVQLRQGDSGHMSALVSLLQSDSDPELLPLSESSPAPGPPPAPPPSWCQCSCCGAAPVHTEALCCRLSRGPCLSSSSAFQRIVLSRSVLEARLLIREPLGAARRSDRELRHCAYEQYVAWRIGAPPPHTHAVVPRCCVLAIRGRYPNENGHYSGFRPIRAKEGRDISNSRK